MLILASQSRTRQALLNGAGLDFVARSAAVDERAIEAELVDRPPERIAAALSEAKSLTVSRLSPGALVIGADQVLALDGHLLHKAPDLQAARQRLDVLRGRTHALHSGVAIARDGTILWSGVETARLTMRDFSAAERDDVLAQEGETVLGSVGAYRLEGPSIRLFERIEGDYFTILGLPLLPLLAALRRIAPESLKS
jgi:septum formation protein